MQSITQSLCCRVDSRALERCEYCRHGGASSGALGITGHGHSSRSEWKPRWSRKYRSARQIPVTTKVGQKPQRAGVVIRLYLNEVDGRTIADLYPCDTYLRKVRAPVDR